MKVLLPAVSVCMHAVVRRWGTRASFHVCLPFSLCDDQRHARRVCMAGAVKTVCDVCGLYTLYGVAHRHPAQRVSTQGAWHGTTSACLLDLSKSPADNPKP